MVPTITWDGDRNRFMEAQAQFAKNKPLYQVDSEWSREFEPLSPKLDQLVVSGGTRDYNHWYLWHTVVPEKFEAVLLLTIPQREGPPRLVERKLSSGRHKIQVQAEPRDDAPAANLKLWVGADDKQSYELPQQLAARPAAHPPIVQVLNPGDTGRLLTRPLTTSPQAFVVEIKLLPQGVAAPDANRASTQVEAAAGSEKKLGSLSGRFVYDGAAPAMKNLY